MKINGKLLKAVNSFADKGKYARNYKKGVNLEFIKDDGVVYTATDANILLTIKDTSEKPEKDCNGIISSETIKKLDKVYYDLKVDGVADIKLSNGNGSIKDKFIEGNFPDYKRVIPEEIKEFKDQAVGLNLELLDKVGKFLKAMGFKVKHFKLVLNEDKTCPQLIEFFDMPKNLEIKCVIMPVRI